MKLFLTAVLTSLLSVGPARADFVTVAKSAAASSGWATNGGTTALFNATDSVLIGTTSGSGTSSKLRVYTSAGDIAWFENTSGTGIVWIRNSASNGEMRLLLDSGSGNGRSEMGYLYNGSQVWVTGSDNGVGQMYRIAPGSSWSTSTGYTQLQTGFHGFGTINPTTKVHMSSGILTIDGTSSGFDMARNNTSIRGRDSAGSLRQMIKWDSADTIQIGDVGGGYNLQLNAGISSMTFTAGGLFFPQVFDTTQLDAKSPPSLGNSGGRGGMVFNSTLGMICVSTGTGAGAFVRSTDYVTACR